MQKFFKFYNVHSIIDVGQGRNLGHEIFNCGHFLISFLQIFPKFDKRRSFNKAEGLGKKV